MPSDQNTDQPGNSDNFLYEISIACNLDFDHFISHRGTPSATSTKNAYTCASPSATPSSSPSDVTNGTMSAKNVYPYASPIARPSASPREVPNDTPSARPALPSATPSATPSVHLTVRCLAYPRVPSASNKPYNGLSATDFLSDQNPDQPGNSDNFLYEISIA